MWTALVFICDGEMNSYYLARGHLDWRLSIHTPYSHDSNEMSLAAIIPVLSSAEGWN